MSHPEIFFRETEFKQIAKKYSQTKKNIDSEVETYFFNTNSMTDYITGLIF